MCTAEKLKSGPAEIRGLFDIPRTFDHTGNMGPIDKFPRRSGPIIRKRNYDAREMVMAEWGHPYYKQEKGPDGKYQLALKKNGEPYAPTPTTNIRHPHYPMFRDYLTPEFRCLVPSNFFAEPNPKAKTPGQPKNIWFSMQDEGALYAFAGIWRPWDGDWIKDRGEDSSEVYAFLTTEPNPLVKKYHPKAMPVILHEDDYDTWLSADWQNAKKLQRPFPADEMMIVSEE